MAGSSHLWLSSRAKARQNAPGPLKMQGWRWRTREADATDSRTYRFLSFRAKPRNLPAAGTGPYARHTPKDAAPPDAGPVCARPIRTSVRATEGTSPSRPDPSAALGVTEGATATKRHNERPTRPILVRGVSCHSERSRGICRRPKSTRMLGIRPMTLRRRMLVPSGLGAYVRWSTRRRAHPRPGQTPRLRSG